MKAVTVHWSAPPPIPSPVNKTAAPPTGSTHIIQVRVTTTPAPAFTASPTAQRVLLESTAILPVFLSFHYLASGAGLSKKIARGSYVAVTDQRISCRRAFARVGRAASIALMSLASSGCKPSSALPSAVPGVFSSPRGSVMAIQPGGTVLFSPSELDLPPLGLRGNHPRWVFVRRSGEKEWKVVSPSSSDLLHARIAVSPAGCSLQLPSLAELSRLEMSRHPPRSRPRLWSRGASPRPDN